MVGVDEFVERLYRVGSDRGPRRFPKKARDREILVKSILLGMDGARVYDEDEINALLLAWVRDVAPAISTDHVTLRRLLVDLGHLERSRDGRDYRVGFPAHAVAFDLAIDQLDLPATMTAQRESAALTRRARAPSPGSSTRAPADRPRPRSGRRRR